MRAKANHFFLERFFYFLFTLHHIDPTSTPHPLCIDLTPAPRRPHIHSASTLHRPHIDPISTPHRLYIDPTSTSHRPHIEPHIDPTSALHRPYTDPTSTSHRLYIGLTWTQHWPRIDPTSAGLTPTPCHRRLFLAHHELTNENVSCFPINQSKTKTFIVLEITRKPVRPVKSLKE